MKDLETKIVAADALIPLERADRQMDLLEMEARPLRRQLEQVRHEAYAHARLLALVEDPQDLAVLRGERVPGVGLDLDVRGCRRRRKPE